MAKVPRLIILGGLPGVGKTTIGRNVARQLLATYLRIDSVEEAIRSCLRTEDVGPAGYVVAYSLATANLTLGHIVLADSVNPLEITRGAWRQVAADSGATSLDVEIICSNMAEHRRRVESRIADIPGSKLPDWEAVLAKRAEYESRTDARLVIDSAAVSANDAASMIIAEVQASVRV